MTNLETAMLATIARSDYRDGGALNAPVWTDAVIDDSGHERKAAGGILSSMSQKGLIVIDGAGNDSTVALTKEGIAALTTAYPDTHF